jgi:hypothetical protein
MGNQRRTSLDKRSLNEERVDRCRLEELYIILTKRIIAIDEVFKNPHKIAISIHSLSDEIHLWGGSLTYEEIEKKEV